MSEIKIRAYNPKFSGAGSISPPATIQTWLKNAVSTSKEYSGFEHRIGEFYDGLVYMLYTGLHDKNGKEIYRGDILRIETYTDTYKVGEVEYDLGTFVSCGYPIQDYMLSKTENRVEVIGNIYENPELLESGK